MASVEFLSVGGGQVGGEGGRRQRNSPAQGLPVCSVGLARWNPGCQDVTLPSGEKPGALEVLFWKMGWTQGRAKRAHEPLWGLHGPPHQMPARLICQSNTSYPDSTFPGPRD